MELKTFEELINVSGKTGQKIFEIAQDIEAKNSEITVLGVRAKAEKNLKVMKEAIKRGVTSKELSSSALSGNDCEKLKNKYKNGQLIYPHHLQNIILYALATAEENARMGKIAACPTAGSCGIVPAVLISISEYLQSGEEKEIDALITAGYVGKIISQKIALAGAVMGCQGECGVASAMAAAAAVTLMNGSTEQTINAASLALKNIMGLVCDPVAGLVEVPCVKRNPFLAMHALTAAEMGLSDIKSIIPIDEIIDAVKQVGNLMSSSLKESSQAGLASTKTALTISENLKDKYDF